MRSLMTLLALALIAAGRPAPQTQAQPASPAFEIQGLVTGVRETKFPHVAAHGSTVYLAANINRESAAFWAKPDAAPAFDAPEHLGAAEGQPDYSTAAVATSPDGTLFYVWVNQPARTIFLRIRRPGQDWMPAQMIASGQPFPVFPEVAATSDGQVFVVWRNPDRPFLYRRSADGGATWGPILPLSDGAAVNVADLAVGPQGQLAAAYMGGEGDRLQIYVALWDGSGFTRARVSRLNGDYADPSATFTPDGRLFVGWRGVADGGSTAGVFVAERQADGSYPIDRLIGGQVQGRVTIEADQAGNLHAIWSAGEVVWYSVKPATGAWTSPIAAPAAGGLLFNVHAAVSAGAGGAILVHAASEVFLGSQVALRHYRFRSGLTASSPPSARPVLEHGASSSRAGALALSFSEVSGAPTAVRYRWGSPPGDSDPWLPYADQMMVTAPAPQSARCSTAPLYTQVRAGELIQPEARADSILLDRAVQAQVAHQRENAAPGYTNRPTLHVRVTAPDECSGLATIRPLIAGIAPATIAGTPFEVGIDLPDQPGRHERGIELTDRLGNTAAYTVAVTYDPTAPAATFGGPLRIIPSDTASIEQTIQARGATYRDDEGEEVLPWAVAVAISRAPINPAAPDLAWVIVPLGRHVSWGQDDQGKRVLIAEPTITITAWLPRSELTPGAYHYALALVDRAGNRTATATTGSLELETVTYFRYALPLVRR